MLIEFSVANFYSIKERQTFSMVASKGNELEETHTFLAPISGGRDEIRLLRSAAVYGANAAGKTTLLFAMDVMHQVVLGSASDLVSKDDVPVTPFALDAKTRKMPSEFEMHFIVDKVRYQYGFTATQKRVVDEWLIAYPHGRGRHWFSRAWSSKRNEHEWEFGAFFTGEKKLWQGATRDNALFLSTAVKFNSKQLQPVYDWFANNAHSIKDQSMTLAGSMVDILASTETKKVLDFTKAADLGIHDLHMQERDLDTSNLPANMPENIRQAISENLQDEKVWEMHTVHLDAAGEHVRFPVGAESAGTNKIISFSGLWIDALEKGYAILVDELHHNLHVELVKFLVNLFHQEQTNPRNAQLIFTTHETSLLNQEFLRRDQIWFCEKSEKDETTLYPLTDFHPRKGRENLELGYISGVYGAVPYIRKP